MNQQPSTPKTNEPLETGGAIAVVDSPTEELQDRQDIEPPPLAAHRTPTPPHSSRKEEDGKAKGVVGNAEEEEQEKAVEVEDEIPATQPDPEEERSEEEAPHKDSIGRSATPTASPTTRSGSPQGGIHPLQARLHEGK